MKRDDANDNYISETITTIKTTYIPFGSVIIAIDEPENRTRLSLTVSEIFDRKHIALNGERVIKLNNYVVQLIGLASVTTRDGSFTIFLLIHDMSHDAHFSTRQNMEPEEFLEKISNFSLHRFFRYLTPNMALQKIILTSFFFFFFFFLLLPDRGLCVLRDITPRRH